MNPLEKELVVPQLIVRAAMMFSIIPLCIDRQFLQTMSVLFKGTVRLCLI